jgi:hypothetical protein
MDLFATAGGTRVEPPKGAIEQQDLLPTLSERLRERTRWFFGCQGARLAAVRTRWKLHVLPRDRREAVWGRSGSDRAAPMA